MENYGLTMVDSARRLVESWREVFDRHGYVDVDTDQAMTGLTIALICKTMFDSELAATSAEIAEAVSVLSEITFYEM